MLRVILLNGIVLNLIRLSVIRLSVVASCNHKCLFEKMTNAFFLYSLSFSLSLSIYIYICVCVCVCVHCKTPDIGQGYMGVSLRVGLLGQNMLCFISLISFNLSVIENDG